MSILNWLFGRRRSVEPLLTMNKPVVKDPVYDEKQSLQMQQIREVSKRLDQAAAELDQAQLGLRTMKTDIKKDDSHGA